MSDLGDTNVAYTVTPFLTDKECADVVQMAQPHFRSTDSLFPSAVRKSHRAMVRSPSLARDLYMRLMRTMKPADYTHRTPTLFWLRGYMGASVRE